MAERDPSLNALKHGGRSNQLLVGDEKQEDFDRLDAAWRGKYEMDGQDGESLLSRVVLNDWLLQRAERNYLNVEAGLGDIDPLEWTLEQHKKLELFQRYKTTAERAFARFYNMLRGLRKDRMKEEFSLDNVRKVMERIARESKEKEESKKEEAQAKPASKRTSEQAPAKAAAPTPFFAGQNSPKKMRKIPILEQWVEVTVQDGKTMTRVVPTNEEAIEKGKRMWPAPELVYRRFNFVDGVPEEYYWTTDDEQTRKYGGRGIQRMTVDTWLEMIQDETPGMHLTPTPKGTVNLPRPKERGGCDCPVCTKNQEFLDRQAAGQQR